MTGATSRTGPRWLVHIGIIDVGGPVDALYFRGSTVVEAVRRDGAFLTHDVVAFTTVDPHARPQGQEFGAVANRLLGKLAETPSRRAIQAAHPSPRGRLRGAPIRLAR